MTRPHRVTRDPAGTVQVWRGRSRRFLWNAIVWLAITVALAAVGASWALVALSAAASLLSAAVVVKGRRLVAAAERTPRSSPDRPVG